MAEKKSTASGPTAEDNELELLHRHLDEFERYHFTSSFEIMEKVRNYWNNLSFSSKREFVRVKYSNLVEFSKFSRYHIFRRAVLVDAKDFVPKHQKWNLWFCNHCYLSFPDEDSHFQHVLDKYLVYPSETMKNFVKPLRPVEDWDYIVKYGNWTPVKKGNSTFDVFNYKVRRCALMEIQSTLKRLLDRKLLLNMHINHILNKAQRFGCPPDAEGIRRICALDGVQLEIILTFLKGIEERAESRSPSQPSRPKVILEDDMLYLVLEDVSSADTPSYNMDLLQWIFNDQNVDAELCSKFHFETESKTEMDANLLEFQRLLGSCQGNLQLRNNDEWVLLLSEEIHKFEYIINKNGAADYRDYLLFVLKEYFQFKLTMIVDRNNDSYLDFVKTSDEEEAKWLKLLELRHRATIGKDEDPVIEAKIQAFAGKIYEKQQASVGLNEGVNVEAEIQDAAKQISDFRTARETREVEVASSIIGEHFEREKNWSEEKKVFISNQQEWAEAVCELFKSGLELMCEKDGSLAQFRLKGEVFKELCCKMIQKEESKGN